MKGQRCYLGPDALAYFQQDLHNLAPKKIFLLRGKGSYEKCGAKFALEEIFECENLCAEEWFDFDENPKIEDALRGLKLLRASEATVIIACGGGSVIDMAKLIRFAYAYEGELTGDSFLKKAELLPLFAMPTTSGTGCEATPFAVCYKDNRKYSVAHDDMLPDCAVIYPPFTFENPSYLTACTGLDALAQATEAFWNKNQTTESDRYALDALELIIHNLPKAVLNDDREARIKLSEGAYKSGKAIAITKTTAPHAYSYAFTTYCGYPHGHAVALTFPFFFELNVCKYHNHLQKGIDENMYNNRMQKLINIYGVEPINAMNKIQSYIECLGLTNKGYRGYSIHDLISMVNIERLRNNPVQIDDLNLSELEQYLTK